MESLAQRVIRRLEEARLSAPGATEDSVAAAAHHGQSWYNKLKKTGAGKVTLDDLQAMAGVVNVTLEWLMSPTAQEISERERWMSYYESLKEKRDGAFSLLEWLKNSPTSPPAEVPPVRPEPRTRSSSQQKRVKSATKKPGR